MRRIVLVLAAAAALAGGAALVLDRDELPDTVNGLPVIEQSRCDDTGSCAAGVFIGDRFYHLGPAGLKPEHQSGPVYARSRPGDRFTAEARVIEGWDPRALVAMQFGGEWRAMRGEGPTSDDKARRICAMTTTVEANSWCATEAARSGNIGG